MPLLSWFNRDVDLTRAALYLMAQKKDEKGRDVREQLLAVINGE